MLTPIAKYSKYTTQGDVMVKIILSAGVSSKRIDQNDDIVSARFPGRGVLNSSTISLKCYRSCPVDGSCHTEGVGWRIYLLSWKE